MVFLLVSYKVSINKDNITYSTLVLTAHTSRSDISDSDDVSSVVSSTFLASCCRTILGFSTKSTTLGGFSASAATLSFLQGGYFYKDNVRW